MFDKRNLLIPDKNRHYQTWWQLLHIGIFLALLGNLDIDGFYSFEEAAHPLLDMRIFFTKFTSWIGVAVLKSSDFSSNLPTSTRLQLYRRWSFPTCREEFLNKLSSSIGVLDLLKTTDFLSDLPISMQSWLKFPPGNWFLPWKYHAWKYHFHNFWTKIIDLVNGPFETNLIIFYQAEISSFLYSNHSFDDIPPVLSQRSPI